MKLKNEFHGQSARLYQLSARTQKHQDTLQKYKINSLEYEEKFNRFSNAVKKNKNRIELEQMKNEWIAEWIRLKEEYKNAEINLNQFVEERNTLFTSYDDDLRDCSISKNMYNTFDVKDLNMLKQELRKQLSEAKGSKEMHKLVRSRLKQYLSESEDNLLSLDEPKDEDDDLYHHNEPSDISLPIHSYKDKVLELIEREVPEFEEEEGELREVFVNSIVNIVEEYEKKIEKSVAKKSELKDLRKLNGEQHSVYRKINLELIARKNTTLKELSSRCTRDMKEINRFRKWMYGKERKEELNVSEKQIMEHHQLHLAIKLEECKIRDLNIELRKKVNLQIQKMKEAMDLSVQLHRLNMEKEKEKQQFEIHKEELKNNLEIMRRKKDMQKQEEYEKLKAMQEQQAVMEFEKQKKEHQRREEQKKKLLQYYEENEEMKRKFEEYRKQNEAEKQQQLALESKHHLKRVHFRRQKQKEKLVEREVKQLDEMFLKEYQEMKLDVLRQQVKSTLDPEALQRNPERVLQNTVESQNKQRTFQKHWYSLTAPDNDQSAFKPLHGYSDNEIMKDTRIRLQMALREAGLMDTEYARKVVSEAKAAKPVRIDMLTTEEKNRIPKVPHLES